jgi:hypothetical protein
MTLDFHQLKVKDILKDLGYPYIPTYWTDGARAATDSNLLEINVHGYRITISEDNLMTMIAYAWKFPKNIVNEYIIEWPKVNGLMPKSTKYYVRDNEVRYHNVISYLRNNFKQSIIHHLKQ